MRFSRNVCFFGAFFGVLSAVPLADAFDGETAPTSAAFIVALTIGFLLFDMEYARIRRDEE